MTQKKRERSRLWASTRLAPTSLGEGLGSSVVQWEGRGSEVRGPGFPSGCSTCAEIFTGLSLLVYNLRGIKDTVSEVFFRHKIL